MASLREIADCIGIKKNFEVVRDFFGYQTGAPGQISLLRQMRLAQGHHVHLNLIRVGEWPRYSTDADEQEIDSAVAFTRDTYATVDFGVANVGRRAISSDKAGGFANIGSDDEAVELRRASLRSTTSASMSSSSARMPDRASDRDRSSGRRTRTSRRR